MMEHVKLNWLTNFIRVIPDNVLRDLYVCEKHQDGIPPMAVLRRLNTVLERTKQTVLDMKASLDKARIVQQAQALHQDYNIYRFTLRVLGARASPQQLKADFKDYLGGFAPNVQRVFSETS